VEGWHTRLNLQCGRRQHGKGLPLYMVIDALAKEAILVELYEEVLLQNHSITLRARKRTYTGLNAKLFSLWEQHQDNTISTKDLLLQCAKLYSDFNYISLPIILMTFANVNSKKNSFFQNAVIYCIQIKCFSSV
jgi:hypothetical protein